MCSDPEQGGRPPTPKGPTGAGDEGRAGHAGPSDSGGPRTRPGRVSPAAIWLPAAFAFLLRLAAWAVLCPAGPARPSPDEQDYLTLALSSWNATPALALLPTRPPVYPLFLRALGGSFWALVVQAVLGAITVGLVARLAGRHKGSKAAWLAGFLLALDPLSILYPLFFLSEILFATLLTAAVGVALSVNTRSGNGAAARGDGLEPGGAERPESRKKMLPFWTGLLFALLALSRPIGLIAGPLFTPRGRRRSLLFLTGWILPLLAWGGWVAVRTGEAPLAHLLSRNLVLYQAAPVLSHVERIPLEAAQARLDRNKGTEGSSVRVAARLLLAHPKETLRQVGLGLGRITLGPGWGALRSRLDPSPEEGGRRHTRPEFEGVPRPYAVAGALWCALGYLLAAIGLLRSGGADRFGSPWPRLRFSLLLGLLLVLPAGGEGYSRFRVPAWPLVALLAGSAVSRKNPRV